jgi:hypothetical protein
MGVYSGRRDGCVLYRQSRHYCTAVKVSLAAIVLIWPGSLGYAQSWQTLPTENENIVGGPSASSVSGTQSSPLTDPAFKPAPSLEELFGLMSGFHGSVGSGLSDAKLATLANFVLTQVGAPAAAKVTDADIVATRTGR